MTKSVRTTPLQPEVVATLRHDLKTSFNQILGYLEILLEDAVSEGFQETTPALNEIRSLAKTLLCRVENALGEGRLVSAEELCILAKGIGPDVKRLEEASESVKATMLAMGIKEGVEDIGIVSNGARVLLTQVQEMCG